MLKNARPVFHVGQSGCRNVGISRHIKADLEISVISDFFGVGRVIIPCKIDNFRRLGSLHELMQLFRL